LKYKSYANKEVYYSKMKTKASGGPNSRNNSKINESLNTEMRPNKILRKRKMFLNTFKERNKNNSSFMVGRNSNSKPAKKEPILENNKQINTSREFKVSKTDNKAKRNKSIRERYAWIGLYDQLLQSTHKRNTSAIKSNICIGKANEEKNERSAKNNEKKGMNTVRQSSTMKVLDNKNTVISQANLKKNISRKAENLTKIWK